MNSTSGSKQFPFESIKRLVETALEFIIVSVVPTKKPGHINSLRSEAMPTASIDLALGAKSSLVLAIVSPV